MKTEQNYDWPQDLWAYIISAGSHIQKVPDSK